MWGTVSAFPLSHDLVKQFIGEAWVNQTRSKTLHRSARAGLGSASPREDRDSVKVGFGDVSTSLGMLAGITMLRMKHGIISALPQPKNLGSYPKSIVQSLGIV